MAKKAASASRIAQIEDSEAVADRVLRLDRYQAASNPKRMQCPNDPEHGGLGVHRSGSLLVCSLCDPPHVVSSSVIELETE